MQVFQEPRLASAVGQASEQRCIAALLERLLDPRSAEMEEGPALVKALNVLMLKVLEHCDRTASFESLLRLLATPPATVAVDADAAARFRELVVKCLIKLTKALGATLCEVRLPELLLEIHRYFDALGEEEIRRRGRAADGGDKPLRMVKTILHKLTEMVGHDIHDAFTLCPPRGSTPAPIVYAYVDLNLQSMPDAPGAPRAFASAPNEAGGGDGGADPRARARARRRGCAPPRRCAVAAPASPRREKSPFVKLVATDAGPAAASSETAAASSETAAALSETASSGPAPKTPAPARDPEGERGGDRRCAADAGVSGFEVAACERVQEDRREDHDGGRPGGPVRLLQAVPHGGHPAAPPRGRAWRSRATSRAGCGRLTPPGRRARRRWRRRRRARGGADGRARAAHRAERDAADGARAAEVYRERLAKMAASKKERERRLSGGGAGGAGAAAGAARDGERRAHSASRSAWTASRRSGGERQRRPRHIRWVGSARERRRAAGDVRGPASPHGADTRQRGERDVLDGAEEKRRDATHLTFFLVKNIFA